jgi:hypothetical protein
MTDDTDLDDYVTVPTFCKRTGCKPTFVYEQLRRGRWDGYKSGKLWFIHKHAHHVDRPIP